MITFLKRLFGISKPEPQVEVPYKIEAPVAPEPVSGSEYRVESVAPATTTKEEQKPESKGKKPRAKKAENSSAVEKPAKIKAPRAKKPKANSTPT